MGIYYKHALDKYYSNELIGDSLASAFSYFIENSIAFRVRYKFMSTEDKKLQNVLNNLSMIQSFIRKELLYSSDEQFKEYLCLYGLEDNGLSSKDNLAQNLLETIIRKNIFYWKVKLGNPSFKELAESMMVVNKHVL